MRKDSQKLILAAGGFVKRLFRPLAFRDIDARADVTRELSALVLSVECHYSRIQRYSSSCRFKR